MKELTTMNDANVMSQSDKIQQFLFDPQILNECFDL